MTHIQQRRDQAAVWTSVNPVLYEGEVGHETNTGRSKLGDGSTAWTGLPYKSDVDSVAGKTGIVSLVVADVSGAAPLASPAFTGSPTAPTPLTADNDTSIATTAFVKSQAYAPLASPALTGAPTAPTATPGDSDTSLATTAFVAAAINVAVAAAKLAMNPVGSIYSGVTNTNPGTFIGGTWVAWGSGRVPVGVDAAQAEFDAVEETGGAKTHTLTVAEMPSHAHTGNTQNQSADHSHSGTTNSDGVHQHTFSQNVNAVVTGGGATNVADNTYIAESTSSAGNHGHAFGTGGASVNHTHPIPNDGSNQPHNNLQPYITLFMFKRVS